MSEHLSKASGTPPVVSWLVPIYNGSSYLESALRSIQQQTYIDFEAILVDDGSVDNSREIADAFCSQDKRFRVLKKSNSGIVDALNLGLLDCKGNYIARMDADDLSESNRLAVQTNFMNQNPECVACGSRVTVIDENSRLLRRSTGTDWKGPGPSGFPPKTINLTHPSLLIRTEALRNIGGYCNGFLAAEDYEMLMRLNRLGSLVELPQYLLQYRVHNASESATKIRQQRFSCLKAELLKRAQDLNVSVETSNWIYQRSNLNELIEISDLIGPQFPNTAMLRAYYSAEFLRRAAYRMPRSDVAPHALDTLKSAAKLLPRIGGHENRYFFLLAIRELLRWVVIVLSGRDRRTV